MHAGVYELKFIRIPQQGGLQCWEVVIYWSCLLARRRKSLRLER